jgi:hypothetical protein
MNYSRILSYVFDITGVFILWIVLHFIAANLYPIFCAELSIFGFVKSIFVAQTPHCIALRWVIYNGGNSINSMWISLGLWITAKIFKNIKNKVIESDNQDQDSE